MNVAMIVDNAFFISTKLQQYAGKIKTNCKNNNFFVKKSCVLTQNTLQC